MAPMRLMREIGKMVGQGQKLASRGPTEFTKASEELARSPSGAIYPKHWDLKWKTESIGSKIDAGVDFLQVNLLERMERYAWLQFRFGLALGAIIGSGYGIKYSIEELSSPRPFGQFLSSVNAATDESSNQTAQIPTMSYAEVKVLAIDVNGKMLKEFIVGVEEAANEGLLDTFSRDIVLRHEKKLKTTALTIEQRAEVQASFVHAVVGELKKFNLQIKNNAAASDGDSTSES